MKLTTRISIFGSEMPWLCVNWHQEGNGSCWVGDVSLWTADDKTAPNIGKHTIHVAQSCPLGVISVEVDLSSFCSRASCRFEGTTLTERDLMWATCYARAILSDILNKAFPLK